MDAKIPHAKIRISHVYILRVNRQEEKEKQKTPSDDPSIYFLDVSNEWKKQSSIRQ
jgi:hypothetical protein